MPGYAWGISAEQCITGSKLRKVSGSVCEKCYAMKGRYTGTNVKKAHAKRLDAWQNDPYWVEKMAALIHRKTRRSVKFFRWFDSGDLQGQDMLADLVQISTKVHDVKFWLSTRELGLVRAFQRNNLVIPPNMIIRISAGMIDADPPLAIQHGAKVISKKYADAWYLFSDNRMSYSDTYYCPSSTQHGQCGNCRKCWDKNTPTIAYLEH